MLHVESTSLQAAPAAGLHPTLLRSAFLLTLTLVAIAIAGYHPYSEDAGIYVAGIKQIANPGIFGSSGDFVAPYFRFSVFSEWNAWLILALHLPLAWLLFTMQIATTWLLLSASLQLATRCVRSSLAQWSAVLLVAICLSVPVAGSSLFMADPYLSGRSFSTPLTLFAIAACLDRKMLRAALLLAIGSLFHPLMSIYATGFVLILWAVIRRSLLGITSLIAAAITAGAVIQYSQRNVVESAAYQAAVVTRYYYFLCRWQWYELLGNAAPLLLFALYALWQRNYSQPTPETRQSIALAESCVLIGITSIAVSLLYARPSSHSHLISALQTIRPFLFIYYCMFLLIGGLLGQYLLKQKIWRWIALFATTAAGIAFSQRQAYPASAQVELPWITSSNGWNRAFVWIRENTPTNAIVALDADYIHAPGEDGQGFRAIAERNAIADRAKDGGAAAAFPELADRWMREETAATNLNLITDAERLRRLVPYNVTWIVLESQADTALDCPFADDLAKVCRLKP